MALLAHNLDSTRADVGSYRQSSLHQFEDRFSYTRIDSPTPVPLLQFASHACFYDLTKEVLTTVSREIRVDVVGPTNLWILLYNLVLDINTGISQEELSDILILRARQTRDDYETSVLESEELLEAVGPDTQKDVEDRVLSHDDFLGL